LYLWGWSFNVCLDHYSLKYLLDQRMSTTPQHHWASKLLGFDFTIKYRLGSSNTVTDALSQRDTEASGEVMAISTPSFQLFDDLHTEHKEDLALWSTVEAGDHGEVWHIITVHGCPFVAATSPLLQAILVHTHGTGHEGTKKILHHLRADFHIPSTRDLVREFVCACKICQRKKGEQLRPAGLLQPLEVPSAVWDDVAMDFVEGFPCINRKLMILTIVDLLSKYVHFIPLGHPYSATTMARAFFNNILHLHGIPSSIVSDQDVVFTSTFWRELFELTGIKLRMSSAFHPQSDGQSEATNKVITMYLQCLTGDQPRQWL
jgi:hypothetical protein